jgi:hypothetical protein
MGGGSLRLGLDLLLFRRKGEAWVVVLGVSGLGNVLGMVGCHSMYGVISNNQAWPRWSLGLSLGRGGE